MENIISLRLKSLRKNLCLSTSKVVKELKKANYPYSEQSIYKWESGDIVPSIKIIKILAKIYNCSISYIVDNEAYEYRRVTSIESYYLKVYRSDFLFRSIITLIIKKLERDR